MPLPLTDGEHEIVGEQNADAMPGPMPDLEALGDRIGAIAASIRGVGDRLAVPSLGEELYTAAARLDVVAEDLWRAAP